MRILVFAVAFFGAFGCSVMQTSPPAPENRGREVDPWSDSCRAYLASSAKTLGSWGYPELAAGILRVARNAAGSTIVTYRLEPVSGEFYFVGVASGEPNLPDREWQDQDGHLPEPAMLHGDDPWPPGEIDFKKDYGGHRARVVARDNNTERRHNFAAAFMPAVQYCVGDHSNMTR
jgi:hypothetical protein